jgi:hypothetical protein
LFHEDITFKSGDTMTFAELPKAKTDRHGWLMVGVQTKGSRNTKLAPPTARLWQVTLPP